MDNIFQLLNNFDLKFFTYFFINIGIVFVIIFFIRRSKPATRKVLYIFLTITTIRIFLFDQPFGWYLYKNYIYPKDVGYRQLSTVIHEYNKFLKRPAHTKFLAVGSSQTERIYLEYDKKHDELSKIAFPGGNAIDLILYKDYIKSFNPDYILLHLSEFEMSGKPNLISAVLSPRQNLSLISIYPILHSIAEFYDSKTVLNEIIAGEFFPEYKYSFIPKGIVNKLMKKNETLDIDPDMLTKNFTRLKNFDVKKKEKNIEFNFKLLKKFLSYCKKESLKVIIVEGQYNPSTYSKALLRLNTIVRRKLSALSLEFKNVTFIPRASIMEFTSDDYTDNAHVKPERGYYFVTKLMKTLEEKPLFDI